MEIILGDYKSGHRQEVSNHSLNKLPQFPHLFSGVIRLRNRHEMFDVSPLQLSVWDYYNEPFVSLKEASARYGVKKSKLYAAWHWWLDHQPESPPVGPENVHLNLPPLGRPTKFNEEEECTLAATINGYARNNTPLTRQGVCQLADHFVTLLPPVRRLKCSKPSSRPPVTWVKKFVQRHPSLKLKSVQMIERKRIKAVNKENLTGHISKMRAMMKRYRITSAEQVFNVDGLGISFTNMVGRWIRKAVGLAQEKLVQTDVGTKGNLDHVTIMPVVNAVGQKFKPVVVYPGKQARFRRVNGKYETLHDHLPPCYLHQRKPAGVNSAIFFDWAKNFVMETAHIRQGGRNMLLVFDGYAAHIQFETLLLLKENRTFVLGLPAHTSHVLQPLDVGVFSPFKSFLQRQIHAVARFRITLDPFDVASCISNAHDEIVTRRNIVKGFHAAGAWVVAEGSTSIEPVMEKWLKKDEPITVQSLMKSFEEKSRSLLRNVEVENSGTIRINTASGAHLTADVVLRALKERDELRAKKHMSVEEREDGFTF